MRGSIVATFVAIAIVAGGAGYLIAAGEKRPRADPAAMEKRVNDWAYIGRTKKLSDTEELSLLIVPSELGDIFDLRCLVLRNHEFKQITLMCPEATQTQLGETAR